MVVVWYGGGVVLVWCWCGVMQCNAVQSHVRRIAWNNSCLEFDKLYMDKCKVEDQEKNRSVQM